MTVLVTGGAGYIGTHILVALSSAGRRAVSIDNYSNSSPAAIGRVRELTAADVPAFDADIRDASRLREILARERIASVIHMAGLKAVGESVAYPDRYHANNVEGTRVLLEVLEEAGVRTVVFSSSATVYGAATSVPIKESAPLSPQSPYGQNKVDIERMLAERARSPARWRVANLRYFNPVGAHESGRIGENPSGIPNNLMPFICKVAAGRLDRLQVFGDDYPTPDGTGVRDYVHVVDLAEGHIAALDALTASPAGTVLEINLGTGHGVSVLELVEAFERVNGVKVPRTIAPRRPGDIATCYADVSLANELLGWRATRGIEEMCRDAWRWQVKNPDGYAALTPALSLKGEGETPSPRPSP